MTPKPDTPTKNAVAVITVDTAEVLSSGLDGPTKVKVRCKAGITWNYNWRQGPNFGPLFTPGARLKIAYDVVESTKFAGTMMKFVNEVRQTEEPNSWPDREPYEGGNGNNGGSAYKSSNGNGSKGEFRTPAQLQMMECIHAASRISGIKADELLPLADKFFAHAMAATYDPVQAIVEQAASVLGATPEPETQSVLDDDIPF